MSCPFPSPEMPTIVPDRSARLALTGFLCGLVSFVASMLASFNYFANQLLRNNIQLVHDNILSTIRPSMSEGEVVLLLMAAFPVALVGLILGVQGRHATSRRWLALTGMIFSVITLIAFSYALVELYLAWSPCFTHSCI